MVRRVLIVSPHFPPVNAPDHQRVRMSLPYLEEFGWQAHVLAVDPKYVEGSADPDLLLTVPADIPVTRTRAVPAWMTRRVGLGGLALRAQAFLAREGASILARGGFDLVYFSTTVFLAMALGPVWKRRFGIPYVLDMQDPWLGDYYHRTGIRPPGGWMKYGFAQWLARRYEPGTMRGAGHVLSVSPDYPRMLLERYPDLGEDRFTVLPFGASERDFEAVRSLGIQQPIFDPTDGCIHWCYLGRGGADMAKGLRGLFLSLKILRATSPLIEKLRIHFVGTSYAATGAERTIEPVAQAYGVGDLVSERTQRIPYLQGLALLQASDAILIVGSDDAGYSASKVYPCILARRPVLAVLHERSLATTILRDCKVGPVVGFVADESDEQLANRLRSAVAKILTPLRPEAPKTDWEAFQPYTARTVASGQCEVFDRVVRNHARVDRVGGATSAPLRIKGRDHD